MGEGTTLGQGTALGPGVVLGRNVSLGSRVEVGPGAVIGDGVSIGEDCRVGARVVVFEGTRLGRRVVLKAGAVIGGRGFGYVPGKDGLLAIPHIGACILEDDVEIGSNSCVDRGSVDDTVIGAGTKIDNLVHVAHNCRIGARCFIMACSGIAGSVTIGDDVIVAGAVGIADHVTIGAGARISAKSGVYGDVPPGADLQRVPARPRRQFLRQQGALGQADRNAEGPAGAGQGTEAPWPGQRLNATSPSRESGCTPGPPPGPPAGPAETRAGHRVPPGGSSRHARDPRPPGAGLRHRAAHRPRDRGGRRSTRSNTCWRPPGALELDDMVVRARRPRAAHRRRVLCPLAGVAALGRSAGASRVSRPSTR